MAKSQIRMFYEEQAKITERHVLFMELLQHPTNPLTPQDVDNLIARYPVRYGCYAGFGTKGKES